VGDATARKEEINQEVSKGRGVVGRVKGIPIEFAIEVGIVNLLENIVAYTTTEATLMEHFATRTHSL